MTAAIVSVMDAYHAAMVDARTDRLRALLDPGYSLVHITNYVQPLAEWLDVIDSGQFDYHRIDIDEASLRVTADTATVTGQGTFDATINGMHAPWRLRFTLTFAQRSGEWKIMSARYSSLTR